MCLLKIIEPHGPKFEPDVPLSRAEAVTALARLTRGIDEEAIYTVRFTDVSFDNRSLIAAISLLEEEGALDWIKGDVFEPDRPFTGAEFAGMMKVMLPGSAQVETMRMKNGTMTRGKAAHVLFSELAQRFEFP